MVPHSSQKSSNSTLKKKALNIERALLYGHKEMQRKAVRSAHAEGRDWKKFLYQFLFNYRATPHSTTGVSPAQLLFNRKIGTKLPEATVSNDTPVDSLVRDKDTQAKKKMKPTRDLVVVSLTSKLVTLYWYARRRRTNSQLNLILPLTR